MDIIHTEKWLIHALIVILAYTCAFSVMKIGMDGSITPFLYAAITTGSTCAAHFISIFLFRRKKAIVFYIPFYILMLALCIGITLFVNNVAMVMMFYQNAPLSLAMPITNTAIVALSVILGIVLFRERLTRKQVFGLCLSLVGIVLLNV